MTKNTNALIGLIFCLLIGFGLRAQQDAQYTQYMFNTLSINPAYAGSRGQLTFAGLYRAQWVGLNGAPETFTINLHSPIRESKIGYGLSVINDNIGDGLIQETSVEAAASYTVDFDLDKKLSFGLTVSGDFLSLDFNGLRNVDREGVGLYYHTDRFYVGFSVPKLFNREHFDNNGQNFFSVDRANYYLITGYVFDLNADLKFKPALLTKAVEGAPVQVDVSASFLFNERFSFGAAYRWDAAVSALAGFQVTDQIMLGLAYDRETTELGGTRFNDGSFEIFLRLELLKSFQRTISPRFF